VAEVERDHPLHHERRLTHAILVAAEGRASQAYASHNPGDAWLEAPVVWTVDG